MAVRTEGATAETAAWLDRPGYVVDGVVVAHRDGAVRLGAGGSPGRGREAREALEDLVLSRSATRCTGAGNREREEGPDPFRTAFERDRDRIVHSTVFRRLAGKTQVVCAPPDHVHTRLTHAMEVAQIARGICEGLGLNATMGEAGGLAHDCGHSCLGHAGESAMQGFLGDFDHAVFGADVMLAPLNLTVEVLDAVRNHSWSRPAPSTPEGMAVSLADRIAYCSADVTDAVRLGLVRLQDFPDIVVSVLGTTQRQMVGSLVGSVIEAASSSGVIGLTHEAYEALDALRTFNYERIYMSDLSMRQRAAAIPMLQSLVIRYATSPALLGRPELVDGSDEALDAAVTYVVGMTDRYACDAAVALLGWDERKLPRAV